MDDDVEANLGGHQRIFPRGTFEDKLERLAVNVKEFSERVRAEQRERRLNAVKDTALRAFGMARKSQVVEGKGSPLRMLMAKELGRRQTASGAPAPARIPASSGELSPPTRLDSVARGRNTASCSQPSGAAMVSFANS
eukprot:CAMPEP_0181219620 /NCGR_PEP_ID=MMETSP1096-20121128/28384_1 /TAXON_ID=156174 ORGANISM="Chrysochromulina ericina, Strain CCMP281" /NCGR_SAMPLE_ID=MMETSP1096 /ASSEMBLY_ACC=CAM_ASM_000453 /LENGTH=137 /DNA_ID=CAMNT_0023312035 /DNA_START=52 /DNA_END=465 /DNA_ORIENTATION=-